MPQQRKRTAGATALADEGGGTFDEVLSQRQPSSTAPVANWATPRPEERTTRRRARGAKLKAVPDVDEAADKARLYDRETVDAMYDALDMILPSLHKNDQSVYMHLFRRTIAAGKPKCYISLADLGVLAGVSVSGATYSVRRLEKGSPRLIERTGKTIGKGKKQGVEIEVFWPVE